jgi:hypothetical protein
MLGRLLFVAEFGYHGHYIVDDLLRGKKRQNPHNPVADQMRRMPKRK